MTNLELATIYALSSAPGRAGVAVVRVTGAKAGDSVERIVGSKPPPRCASVRRFRHPNTGEDIDKGIVLWLPGPDSFTGEDCAEFHVHGGTAVINGMLAALGCCQGFRLAEPGEFSRRAFANGKIDLAEAEGVADLIAAETEAQHHQALLQASGALSSLYDGWRGRLIDAAALTEAAIDFSDEADVADDAIKKARDIIVQVLPEIQRHLDDGHRGEILRDGFRVVLAGAPNVGKSSLLNALARREAAIVSPEAGTTRDVVEVRLDLNGYAVLISDTAGLRDQAGDIEREGMRRAKKAMQDAQLVLLLSDDRGKPHDALAKSARDTCDGVVVDVLSKADLFGGDNDLKAARADIAVSAKTGAGLDELIALITDCVARRLEGHASSPAITQARHRQAVERTRDALDGYLSGPAEDAEVRAEDLRQAITALGRITGWVDVEDILDQVFGRFCIGK